MDPALRNAVWERAGSTCEYCRMPQHLDRVRFEVEQIIPEKHDGLTELQNLALSCFFCNRYKGPNLAGIDPETGQIVPLFHPRHDIWPDHFSWSDARLVGRTSKARATIAVLRINDAARVAIRAVLIASGEFSRRILPGLA
jgi:hypothetical protein